MLARCVRIFAKSQSGTGFFCSAIMSALMRDRRSETNTGMTRRTQKLPRRRDAGVNLHEMLVERLTETEQAKFEALATYRYRAPKQMMEFAVTRAKCHLYAVLRELKFESLMSLLRLISDRSSDMDASHSSTP